MHGSSFERVYGKKDLPQVAGFTSSTAPGTAPYPNLQTMSEYMRRHIRGEDIVQPGWRVPPDQMTRNEGVMIGMEAGRKNNLNKSEAGNLQALQLSKVSHEARAMTGDPTAAVFDRQWAKSSEIPERGIYANSQPNVISSTDGSYQQLYDAVLKQSDAAGVPIRDFTANAWAGMREMLKGGELFGVKYPRSAGAVQGDSKGYADIFDELIGQKAAHMRISVGELEKRLRGGDATLMSGLLASPVVAAVYREWRSQQPQAPD